MDDFDLHSAFVEAVEARKHPLHLQVAACREDDLLPERVLLVLVYDEVGGQSLVQEGVVVLEDHLDAILASLSQQGPRQADAMVQILHLSPVEPAPVDLQELHPSASEVEAEFLSFCGESAELEGNGDYSLVGVALHEAEDEAVRDVPQILQRLHSSVSHLIAMSITHELPASSHNYSKGI